MKGKEAVITIKGKDEGTSSLLSKLDKSVEGFSNKISKSNIGNLSYHFNNITTSLGKFSAAAKAAAAVVNDLTATYKVQAKAEVQLEASARNNPYLSRTSVENLKKYAGELQSISIYGDEQLLPYMGELATAGRTEKEIMDVMSAAIDVAASGTMDLGAAVKVLNETYQGSAGTLSKNVKGVKELTQEQLKNGEAVKLVAQQYKGIASETAKATGAAQQLKNAWGDVKEILGGWMENLIGPIQRGLAGILSSLTGVIVKARQAAQQEKNAQDIIQNGTDDPTEAMDAMYAMQDKQIEYQAKETHYQKVKDAYDRAVNAANTRVPANAPAAERGRIDREYDEAVRELADLGYDISAEFQGDIEHQLEYWRGKRQEAQEKVGRLNQVYNAALTRQQLAEQFALDDESAAASAAERAMEAERKKANEKMVKDAKDNYENVLTALESERALYKQLHPEIEAAEIDKIYDMKKIETAERELLAAQKTMGELYDKTWGDAKVEKIKKLRETFAEKYGSEDSGKAKLSKEDEQKLRELNDQIMGILTPDDPNRKLSQILQERLELLRKHFEEVIKMEGLSEEQKAELRMKYHDAENKMLLQIKDQQALEEQEAREKARQDEIKLWQDRLARAQEFAAKFSEIVSTLTDAALEASQAESKARLKQVENEYEQGLVSETEYEEKSKEIKKKAAEEEYRLRLWQWGAQIAQITIDTAQAVMSAMTQPGNPLVNIAMASLVGAMGAAQLGTAMAQKPQAPSFASGGIVPGNSWSGDRVAANVNSGEMILTRAQQADLWRTISGGLGTGGWNVAVNNYMGGRADVSTRRTHEGLVLDIIDAHINQGMARGAYDAGMAGYSVSQKGVTIL